MQLITISSHSNFPTAPSAPEHITAEGISPTEAIIQWMPSKTVHSDMIWYEVHWQTENIVNGVKNRKQQIVPNTSAIYDNEISYISRNLTNLLPNQIYSVWVKAYTSNDTFSESSIVKIQTFPEPENITVLTKTSTTIEIEWNPPKNISKYIIQYTSAMNKNVTIVFNSETTGLSTLPEKYIVENLHPKTVYIFSILIYYPRRDSPYFWPPNERFTYETLADSPTSPGKPILLHLSSNVYRIKWDPAKDNGATIEEYSLEGKNQTSQTNSSNNRVKRSISSMNTSCNEGMMIHGEVNWVICYNGNETWWLIGDLHIFTNVIFRVRARNALGWGPYSLESEPVRPVAEQYAPGNNDTIIYKSMFGLSALGLVIICITIYCE